MMVERERAGLSQGLVEDWARLERKILQMKSELILWVVASCLVQTAFISALLLKLFR